MVHKVARVLVAIGGINWGLIGLGMLMSKDWNVVGMILSFSMPLLAVVYVLVGIATVMVFMPRN